jgi:hypothetical protein
MNPAPPPRTTSTCYVELLGSARLQAGRKQLSIELDAPATIPDLLGRLAEICPDLVGPVLDGETRTLVAGHVLNRNGRDFLTDGDLVLPGDRLLLMSSTAGG